MNRSQKTHRSVITLVIFVFTFTLFLYIAQYLSGSAQVQETVGAFGYLGVLIIAVIAGLNAIVPLPAATFTPIFLSAGLTIPLIIITLTLGTVIADFTGFFLGRLSRDLIQEKHPKIFAFITEFRDTHSKWVVVVVAGYAAFAPLPNEVILIPLGLTGIRFTSLILPLLIGNAVNQLLLVYGVLGLANALF